MTGHGWEGQISVGWLPEWQRQRQTQIPFGNDKGEEADPCGMTTRRAKAKAKAKAKARQRQRQTQIRCGNDKGDRCKLDLSGGCLFGEEQGGGDGQGEEGGYDGQGDEGADVDPVGEEHLGGGEGEDGGEAEVEEAEL
jgi:hypothetical protein